jgi:hypothetical protein
MPIIESGKSLKRNGGPLSIKFSKSFTAPPNVVVTSFWENQGLEVAHDETIESVSTTGFNITSQNAGPNYYVSWIAVQND